MAEGLKAARHNELLEILASVESIQVPELATCLGVSEVTARRDLLELEKAGYLKRVHGGAVKAPGRSTGRPYRVREKAATDRKQAIAVAAAQLVTSGDAIALDSGSTVMHLVGALNGLTSLTVVTANLRTAWAVAQSRDFAPPSRLIVIGGAVKSDELSVSGISALEQCRNLRVDTAFVGASAVDSTAGVTDYDYEDAAIKRAIIQGARQVVVLADGSKLGKQALALVADLAQVDTLITDDAADKTLLAELAERVRVVAVSPAAAGARRGQPAQ